MKKIKWFLSEHPEYIAIMAITIIAVILIIQFTKSDVISSMRAYFQKPITEMSIGELVMWLWFISAVFSREKLD